MLLVKTLTRVLEFTAKLKLNRAQKHSDKAMWAFKSAQSRMTRSNHELQVTQAEILIQLNKLDSVEKDVISQKAMNDRKILAIKGAMEVINE